MIKGLILGMIIGAVLGGFFNAFGKDLYNWCKDKLFSIFGKSKLTDANLKEETLDLHKNITQFLRERENNEPQTIRDNWRESTNNRIRYSRDTMNLYDANFSAKVIAIRQEYFRRNIKSESLEKFYKHPTNPLGIREITNGLAELAGKLEET